MTTPEWIMIAAVGLFGHALALFWYLALKGKWKICERTIYDLPIKPRQYRRELLNSIHTPIHAVILGVFVWFGYFDGRSWVSFGVTLIGTFIWAEIWHYFSHRAMHLKPLHWIHVEHHKSRLNTPFTAISFNFSEKLIFDIGLLLPLVVLDQVVAVNFYGIAVWYLGYLLANSFQHANFEIRPAAFNRHLGKYLTTTTYHSLHHSRYTGNYGLATRFLDRWLGTEWEDYERLYDRVCGGEQPLTTLRERVGPR